MNAIAFSDEDLTAFLDGEADAELSQRVETALQNDAALAARLDGLGLPMPAFAAAGDLALAMAPPMPELPASTLAAANSPSGPRAWVQMTAAAAVLLVGVGLGTVLTRSPAEPTPWIDAIVAYQVLYVPETIANSNQSPAQTAAVLANFETGSEELVEEVRALEGLTFARAQLLGFNTRPLLQVAYATDDGTPIALCAVRVTEADRGFSTEVIDGLAATHWVSDGVGYVIVGGDSLTDIEAWAKSAAANITL